MLDLVKLTAQVTALSQHLQQEASGSQHRLHKALLTYDHLCQDPSLWQNRYQDWHEQLTFSCASPAEPLKGTQLDQGIPVSAPPQIHSVVATDGSQIVPNHHEIAYCSLINVGRVALHYGEGRWPLLDSVPVLFYRSAELQRSRGISVEDMLALRRTQSEVEELAELALGGRQRSPVLALMDGSLIHWGLESLPMEEQRSWLQPILNAYDRLRKAHIPVLGYISASRSSEVIHYLRLGLCPYLGCECQRFCGAVAKLPCDPFSPLNDRTFWGEILQPGQRSPLWRSGARILEHYGDQHIHCCYLHVGEEVARIEFPGWLMADPQLLDLALGMVLAQVKKGLGYPVALAEAHHLAVVRGGDRQRFFALVEQELIRAGLRNIAVSRKEARKRGGIA